MTQNEIGKLVLADKMRDLLANLDRLYEEANYYGLTMHSHRLKEAKKSILKLWESQGSGVVL